MKLIPLIITVGITLAIVAYILAYTNLYETDLKPFLKNESYFAGNLWATNLKSDKDYDGYIDYYKAHLCEHMNETECSSSNVGNFCDYDANTAKCNMKLSRSGNPVYNTPDFETANTRLRQQICSGMPLSSCRESSDLSSGFCEVVNNKCVPRSDDTSPAPAPYPYS